MPAGEDKDSMLQHEYLLQDLARNNETSNELTIHNLMNITFGVRRNMLIQQVNVDGSLRHHPIADVIQRFPFIIHEKYVRRF